MHQVSLKHRDEYFRGSTLIPADAGTSLQDSDTPFRNSLPLWLTLSQIRFSVLTRGTFIFNVQYLVILNISLVYADCQELLGSGMCQSFLCKVQKPYVYCLFRNVLILSLQLRRASLAHPFGNQVNQNPRFT